MPSGKTHDRITLWSLPWLVAITLLLTRNAKLTLIIASGFLFSGLMFGPDLDIYSIQFQRWGKLRWLWLPYQKLLRHRSLLSHGFLIGTTIRLLYLLSLMLIVTIFVVALAQSIGGFYWNWQEFGQTIARGIIGKYRPEAIATFAGLELGAMSHSVSDTLSSNYKRYQKRQKAKTKTKRRKRI